MSGKQLKALRQLIELAHREHYNNNEDKFYGCPLSPDGCSNDFCKKDECNCGASAHNAEVDSLAKELLSATRYEHKAA